MAGNNTAAQPLSGVVRGVGDQFGVDLANEVKTGTILPVANGGTGTNSGGISGVVIHNSILTVKNLAGTTLTASAGAGVFGLSTTATFGSPAQLSLVTEVANSNTKTDACEFEVTLPAKYVAGSAISVNIGQKITIGAGTLSVKSLTVDAFLMAADGTAGSNLGPAAGTLTNTQGTLAFAITPTGLVAGNKLLIQIQTVLTETAASNVTANLTSITVTTSTT